MGSATGVPRDQPAAARWCRRAAEQGMPEAQDRLGIMYAEGAGLPRDGAAALAWFMVAARSGSTDGEQHRRYLEAHVDLSVTLAAQRKAQEILAALEATKAKAAK